MNTTVWYLSHDLSHDPKLKAIGSIEEVRNLLIDYPSDSKIFFVWLLDEQKGFTLHYLIKEGTIRKLFKH